MLQQTSDINYKGHNTLSHYTLIYKISFHSHFSSLKRYNKNLLNFVTICKKKKIKTPCISVIMYI